MQGNKQLQALVPSCPVLVHKGGYAEWGNQAFIDHFGFTPIAAKRLKVRELLWGLGIQDPLAGMIADGVIFDRCDVPPLNRALPELSLRQSPLPGDEAGSGRFMLVISDDVERDMIK